MNGKKHQTKEDISSLLQCLSILEDKAGFLYNKLSEKTAEEILKLKFERISNDSKKHALSLRSVSEKIGVPKISEKNCRKKLGSVFETIEVLTKAVSETSITTDQFSAFIEQLKTLESSFGEEYFMMIQAKTFQLMSKEINQLYGINFDDFGPIITSIAQDEENHRQILEQILRTITERINENDKKPPKVQYQNPDGWIRTTPNSP